VSRKSAENRKKRTGINKNNSPKETVSNNKRLIPMD